MPDARDLKIPGFGNRTRSQNHRIRNRPSHTNIPAISRGDHAAGTTHISPNAIATKNRVPNPNPNQPAVRARADVTGGTNVASVEAARGPAPGANSLRNLDRGKNFRHDRIRREAFQVGFRLQHQPVPKDGGSSGLDIVRNQEIAALHSGKSARHKK